MEVVQNVISVTNH